MIRDGLKLYQVALKTTCGDVENASTLYEKALMCPKSEHEEERSM